jgi:predicted RNA-binding Zn ribbon-like protein
MQRAAARLAQVAPTTAIPAQISDFACIEFVNSAFSDYLGGSPSVDRLPLSEWQAWFLARFGLRLPRRCQAPLSTLQAMRMEVRRVLEHWAATGALASRDFTRLNRWLACTSLRRRLVASEDRLELIVEPLARDWNWVIAAIAASVVELVADGQPDRLKVCANPNCSWMFYDATRNHSRRFCSAQLCGNVVRVRSFRHRKSTRY